MAIQLLSTANVAEMTFKKIAIHGKSGIGKTMLAATCAPYSPLIILTEKTGTESLQPAMIEEAYGKGREDILYDIDVIEAYEPEDFVEAVAYANKSPHDLIIFDSFSKASRLILKAKKAMFSDGRKAYGEHNDAALALVESLTELNKHSIYLCHTTRIEDGESGSIEYKPGFEGKGFIEKFVYDLAHVLHLELAFDDDGTSYRALRCHQGDSDKFAKNRGGRLAELEEPHIGRLIAKLSAGAKKPKPKKK